MLVPKAQVGAKTSRRVPVPALQEQLWTTGLLLMIVPSGDFLFETLGSPHGALVALSHAMSSAFGADGELLQQAASSHGRWPC